jgi:hypothetical protein
MTAIELYVSHAARQLCKPLYNVHDFANSRFQPSCLLQCETGATRTMQSVSLSDRISHITELKRQQQAELAHKERERKEELERRR